MRLPARETDLVTATLELCAYRGFFAWRANAGSLRDRTGRPVRFGFAGCPDVLLVAPGARLAGIELKRRAIPGVQRGGRLSEVQLATFARLIDVGVPILITGDLGEVEVFLNQLTKGVRSQ